MNALPTPPIAEKRQNSVIQHGVRRDDPYAWLRAENWQEVMQSPEALPDDIRAYLAAENSYLDDSFETPKADLIDRLYWEMRGRIKEDETGLPDPDGPWAYNVRMVEGQQYPLVVRTPRFGGPETILLDCNIEAGDGYFGFGGADHSPDHTLLGWAADRQGSEYQTIHIRDIATGQDTGEVIEHAADGGVWSQDGRSIYYCEYDDSHRPYRVRRHDLGTPQSSDAIIFEEPDPGFFVGVGETQNRRFISIDIHDHQTSECWLIERTGEAPRLVAARVSEREYDVEARGDQLYILTNAEDAEDFKIVTAPLAAPDADHWTDLVQHVPGVLILDMIVLARHMVRLERVDGLPRLVVRDLRDGREWQVVFDEEAYSLGVSAGLEFDVTTVRFTYSSPTTPQRTYDLDLESGERTLLKEQEVPSGHCPVDYISRRVFATAPDGERVPVTLLYHRNTKIDGTAPALLYGYGAYGYSIPASFSIAALSVVDRGAIYAVAHVRGGMEKGYRWYREGRREKKNNTFMDFIAAAEMLVSDGFAAPGRIVAEGGSAGGLLMGTIANVRPDLWAGILAEVPFVDVLNTMSDDTLPLTPPEWPEWGNPIESEEDYRRISGYAPYEQIKAQAYPPILAIAGVSDPRVTYWEPAKWVARLRATKTDSNPLYLKTHMAAGHSGASGRFEHLKETALGYAFALDCLGLG